MVVGERGVSQDTHQSDDRHSGIKLIQGQVAHVHQHFTGAVVRWEKEIKEGGYVCVFLVVGGHSWLGGTATLGVGIKSNMIEACIEYGKG